MDAGPPLTADRPTTGKADSHGTRHDRTHQYLRNTLRSTR
jgi:hypothetical protein